MLICGTIRLSVGAVRKFCCWIESIGPSPHSVMMVYRTSELQKISVGPLRRPTDFSSVAPIRNAGESTTVLDEIDQDFQWFRNRPSNPPDQPSLHACKRISCSLEHEHLAEKPIGSPIGQASSLSYGAGRSPKTGFRESAALHPPPMRDPEAAPSFRMRSRFKTMARADALPVAAELLGFEFKRPRRKAPHGCLAEGRRRDAACARP